MPIESITIRIATAGSHRRNLTFTQRFYTPLARPIGGDTRGRAHFLTDPLPESDAASSSLNIPSSTRGEHLLEERNRSERRRRDVLRARRPSGARSARADAGRRGIEVAPGPV